MRRLAALFWLALLALGLIGCDIELIEIDFPGEERETGRLRTRQPRDIFRDDQWYEIFFTNPRCPPEAERVGGIDEIIAADLLQAQSSVDIAVFDLDALPIIEALIALRGREIPVRVVTDDGGTEPSSTNRLRRHGISVVEDRRSAFMHNKFIVIDERIVWTGSLNYTSNGAYCNNNNAVRFDVPELAANYRAEMDEMYQQRQFGPTSPLNTPYPQIFVNEVLVETYFAPEERIAPVIAAAIAAAQEEILFLAFSFTEEQIGEAVLGRAQAGVTVRGVFETTGADSPYSYYERMRLAGLPNLEVRKDGNPRIMHHKVLILDRKLVIFGSFNFSSSANQSNDENVVMVYDAEFAGYFIEEFGFVWNEAGS